MISSAHSNTVIMNISNQNTSKEAYCTFSLFKEYSLANNDNQK